MPTPDAFIRLNKHVRASRDRVYQAWTDPRQFRQWWCADPALTRCEIDLDPRVGGQVRIAMEREGVTYAGGGRFVVLEPGRKVSFTWAWDDHPAFSRDTTVTVELFDAENPYDDGPATEIVFTHEGLGSAAERSEHTGGWWDTLRALGYHVRGVDPREAMYPKAPAK